MKKVREITMDDNVICYHETLSGSFAEDTFNLLPIWKESWQRNGWNVSILNEEFAKQHSRYQEYDIDKLSNKLYNKWPNKEYIRSCYRRLFAFCHFVDIHGSTLWADYDVMNYSFEPSLDIRSNTILGSGTSVVYLNQDGSKSIIDNIFKSSGYDNRAGKSRFNPMTAVIRTKGFKQLPREKRIPNDIVKQYEACKTSKFVHYHGGCQRLLQKEKLNSSCRSEFISRFRPA